MAMRLFVSGGSGALGRALLPLARLAGHDVLAPSHREVDLFDPVAVSDAVAGCDAVLHLATRIPELAALGRRDAWHENDRLRTDAARILVDAAIGARAQAFVQPTVTFVYPDGEPADEETPLGEVEPVLRSALEAERQARRFAGSGGRGVVLRLGLLDGPGTGQPQPNDHFGATIHVADAAAGLLAALGAPSGIYNVCRDGERVANARFRRATGWHPREERAQIALESALSTRARA